MKHLVRTACMSLGLACLGTATPAQTLVFSPKATEACLAGVDHPADCIGTSAEACMEATEGGYSTLGMVACTEAELRYWDGQLNAAYGPLMERSRADDGADSKLGIGGSGRADTLRAMQRAWIAYRDAACEYERATWGGGTGGGPAAVGCMMRLTAEQAMALEARLAGE